MSEAKTVSSQQNIIKINNNLNKTTPVTLIQHGKFFKLPTFNNDNSLASLTGENKEKPNRPIRRILLSKVKKESDDMIPKVLTCHDNNSEEASLNNDHRLTYQLNSALDGASNGQTIIHYATQGGDGQFYIPVDDNDYGSNNSSNNNNVSHPTTMHPLNSPFINLPPNLMMVHNQLDLNNQESLEEASRKRELRLLKNKEAAKECRRKKKEYVRCLENRVAVLENQNKTLIEELKSLKELYCQKDMHS